MKKLLILSALALFPSISFAYTCPAPYAAYNCTNFTDAVPGIYSAQPLNLDDGAGNHYGRLGASDISTNVSSLCVQGGAVDNECVIAGLINVGKSVNSRLSTVEAVTANVPKAYEGTSLRSNPFPIFKSATVSAGTAVFNLTTDGTSGAAALCTNGVIQDSVAVGVSDAAASYQMAWVFSNSNKTVTITTNKLTTANILTGILGQSAGNGSVVKLQVWCY